ncbi:MAG TPA: response regulator [Asticcacaulis sp.]
MRRVLILEDSPTQATIISKMFQRAGFDPVCARDKSAALAALAAQGFDLLVLDVFIENSNTLDDLEVYRELAADAPIAVMTAGRIDNPEAGADALNKARRARVSFLLPKPFFFVDVKQVCEDVEAHWSHAAPIPPSAAQRIAG